ncbi:hypothetical protein [Massilia aquatica]|uniref:Uncharacterized protein n=1 Tax=Massilia aquatica TaxID=2609000 RepID=A0ABX0MHH7_9BURK|nr:hypothetical protein [Massilia aquatica]NHZ43845.1 hypothetical protein [Massilia aquatica]
MICAIAAGPPPHACLIDAANASGLPSQVNSSAFMAKAGSGSAVSVSIALCQWALPISLSPAMASKCGNARDRFSTALSTLVHGSSSAIGSSPSNRYARFAMGCFLVTE